LFSCSCFFGEQQSQTHPMRDEWQAEPRNPMLDTARTAGKLKQMMQ
jgi:hypothetical protein